MDTPVPPRDPSRRWVVRRCLLGLGVLATGSAVGTAFSLYLINHFPLLLVALSPLGRNVVLAVPNTHPAVLLAVVVVRRTLFYLCSYWLGRELGPAGITWIETRASYLGRFVRLLERLFARAPRVVVLLFTGPTVSALAGIARMPLAIYLGLATSGLVARMAVTIWLAAFFLEPLEWLLALIDDYWVPGTALMIVAVLLYQWHQLRRART